MVLIRRVFARRIASDQAIGDYLPIGRTRKPSAMSKLSHPEGDPKVRRGNLIAHEADGYLAGRQGVFDRGRDGRRHGQRRRRRRMDVLREGAVHKVLAGV